MRFTHYLYTVLLALLAACSSDELAGGEAGQQPDHPNGAIELQAGIVEGGGEVVTRAGEENGPHGVHLPLTSGTKLALQVSGTWTGHDPVEIVQPTTATLDDETSVDSKHNAVATYDPFLYWDDYGTADPANYNAANKSDGSSSAYGRGVGLTIYGVAIDRKKDAAPTVSSWTALPWTLDTDQRKAGETPADKDLLISNNVQASTAVAGKEFDTGNYKFDEKGYGKLLVFKHALSKVTVHLKAGAGFGGSFTSTRVWLTSNETGQSNAEWVYTTGAIDVTTGDVSSKGGLAAVEMNESGTPPTGYQVTKEALVIPGSAFASDNAVIAKINADGNIYYVKAKEIRTAIDGVNHDSDGAYATEAGKNYVLKIIVNKTDIQVTATVTNWVDVNAAVEEPVINVNADWGASGAPTSNTFSFYRSTSVNNGYSTGLKTGDYYPCESTVSKVGDGWTMSSPLYWPTHDTHYQFRGVWPATVTTAGEGVLTSPRVEDATHDEVYQVIKVKNVPYVAGTFPSDLMIGRPEFEKDGSGHYPTCNNSDHSRTDLYNEGICATEGKINLNFRYMMSQVEVNLTTSGSTASKRVNLSGAVVEIVNVFNTSDVKLGDREVLTTGDKGNYTLDAVANVPDDPATPDVDESVDNSNKRWSAIVPQPLAYTSPQHENNMKFKITITNADSSTDVYYADIQPIPVLEKGAQGPAAPTTHWVSGKHYIYTLHLTKTEVRVSATLTDWKKVEAAAEVWF